MGVGSSSTPAPISQQLYELQREVSGVRLQVQAIADRVSRQQSEILSLVEQLEARITSAENRLFYRLHRLEFATRHIQRRLRSVARATRVNLDTENLLNVFDAIAESDSDDERLFENPRD